MHSSRLGRSARAGFTLVELLISLFLASIFAFVLFNFVSGQARFTMVQGARQEVEQNSRGAVELMMSELRAVPGGAITIAEPSRLQFLVPRVWGMLCGPVAGATVTMVFPPAQTQGEVFPTDFSGANNWGLAIRDSSITNRAVFATAAVRDTATTAGGSCTANLGANLAAAADSNPPKPLQILLTANPVGFLGGAGNMAFMYQTVTYDVGTSGVAPGNWLRRSLALDGSSQQPVAGPLAEAEARPVSFTYLCGAATIDGTVVANRPFITGVRIATAMQSRPSTRSVLQTERDTITVHLRNSGRVTCP